MKTVEFVENGFTRTDIKNYDELFNGVKWKPHSVKGLKTRQIKCYWPATRAIEYWQEQEKKNHIDIQYIFGEIILCETKSKNANILLVKKTKNTKIIRD